jgi:hypothetical protein
VHLALGTRYFLTVQDQDQAPASIMEMHWYPSLVSIDSHNHLASTALVIEDIGLIVIHLLTMGFLA